MLRLNSKHQKQKKTKEKKFQKLKKIKVINLRIPRKKWHQKDLRIPSSQQEIKFPPKLMMPKRQQLVLNQRTKLELPRSRPLLTKLLTKQRMLSRKLQPKLRMLSLTPPKPPEMLLKLLVRKARNLAKRAKRSLKPKPILIPIDS